MFKDKESLTSMNASECVRKFAVIIVCDSLRLLPYYFLFFHSLFFFGFVLFICLFHLIEIASSPPVE